ncbi:MAG: DNA repair protein RadA [Alphaproteobacteria bacterium]|nr:DNA repair protein RadA [Alphaproteobacteria bacterium]
MARSPTHYVCQACGTVAAKWAGKCEGCGEWNTLVEEASGLAAGPRGQRAPSRARSAIALEPLDGDSEDAPRLATGMAEFDRVTGGGLVPGSALLVGGDPGIGKSTVLLQAVAALAGQGAPVAYLSGEEAIAQVRLRARRLGLGTAPVQLAAETHLEAILATLDKAGPFSAVVIDSIQTLWSEAIESAPGTVSQVRAVAQDLVKFAKKRDTAVILVGHVTKDGQIAGPRVVEHMVDAVLYFEGERGHHFRILRTVKNRFGPTDEIGVFEMTDKGLKEVANPSLLFLGERGEQATGTAVFAGIEGTRPLLVEFQALVAPTSYGSPRRAVVGWDNARLAMILAVLEARCGLQFSGHDVYLNVAGGLRISEPGADLAAAAALVSALLAKPLPAETVVFGEAALSGAVRAVAQSDARLKEAAKLGFQRAIMPVNSPSRGESITVTGVGSLADLIAAIGEA